MASNVELNAGSGGASLLTKEVTHDGDTAHLQGVHILGVSGSEGSYTATNISDPTNGLLVNLGSNNDVTVTGTVTADLGATDNAVLDAIAASLAGTLTVGSHAVTNVGTFAVQAAQSGTWTVDLGATDNAVLDAIAASVAGTLTVGSHAVTNAGTFATQESGAALTALQLIDNIVLAEDAVHGSTDPGVQVLAVRRDTPAVGSGADGDYSTINVDASGRLWVHDDVLDAALSGSELQVDVVGALPAGTNNIGDVDIASITAGDNVIGRVKLSDGTDVADILDLANSNPLTVAIVDGSGDQIISFGGGTQYTEDAAAAANPVGTALNLIRADTPAGIASADGDNLAARGTDYGALYVTLLDTGGTEVSVGGGTQYDEDTAHVTGDKVTMAGVVRADTAAAQSGTDGDRTVLITDGSGRLHVNVGNTVTVGSHAVTNAGTFAVQAAQSGTWTVDLGATDNAVLDAIAASVAGTLTVGSHAVTNAGTFAVQVDGSALTALQLIDDPVSVLGTATYTEAATKGMIIGAVRRDADTTLVDTTNEIAPLQVDANGRLKVEAFSGETLPVSLASVPSHAVTNAGTFAVQVDGSALTALQLIDNIVLAEDAAHQSADPGVQILAVRKATPANVSGTDGDYEPLQVSAGRLWASATIDAALPAGTNAIGKLAANSGVDIGDVDVTSISAGTNAIGNVGLIGRTTGGMTIFRSIDLDESEEEVKATAGQVFSISAFNRTAAPLYLKFYNATAANTTVGTTTPVLTFVVPANADSDGAGFIWNNPIGFAFGTAISAAVTTGVADNDTGAPGANDCIVDIGYV